MNVEELSTNGFVTLKYPQGLRLRVEEAMSAWKRFCDLQESEKQMLSNKDLDRVEDFGYMYRNDGGPRADQKELFHLLQLRAPELLAKAEHVTDRRAVEFIRAGDVLIQAIRPTIMEFARSLENVYKMPGFTDEVARSSDFWTFRFLHYFGGDMLANAHADRLGFTLHLYESESGGEYLSFDKQWTPWPVNHEQSIIFPSIGLQHRSRCQLKALWHRVVPNEKTKIEGRYAMVAFIDFPQVREWDKHRFPRVQNLPEGFNYGLTLSQLDSMFTQAAA